MSKVWLAADLIFGLCAILDFLFVTTTLPAMVNFDLFLTVSFILPLIAGILYLVRSRVAFLKNRENYFRAVMIFFIVANILLAYFLLTRTTIPA